MVAEKSAADDGVGGQGLRFARDLQALYAAAGGRSAFGYQRLIRIGEQDGFEVSTSSLSEWFRGTSVPREPSKVRYVLNVLVPFLEDQAALRSPDHQRTAAGTWSARLAAAQAVSKSGQGGRGPRVGAASAGRLLGMPSQALQDALPHEFVGRGAELDASAAFAAAPDGGPSYLWWQADAWAGKSALLAWFATRRLPAGIDAVQHFIARRLGTNRREHFALAVAEQLASLAGRKLRAPERDRPEHHLPALYEEAARAGRNRHRRLLLIVDGLDEDAEAGPGGLSIAALLPKEPPHGMRIIVSGRAHPQVPEDVADEHPLRDPGTVRRLAASPAAHVIRDTALRELHALLEDERIGCRLLGLLVAAQGALTGADLAALAGVRPREVRKRLRSVVGRSMAPTDTDRLELGVRATADADAEAGRQTFVLAHEELFRAAAADLGEAELATYREHLHAWADGYRDGGWPENTPNYLLTGYTRLVQDTGDADRLAELVLDPRRQLRLVQRSGPDVALADLALVAPPAADRTAPSLADSAGAAASREALLPYARTLPRSVVRTVARGGDVRRARALAGVPLEAAAKAVHLADVARVLAAETGNEDAGATAAEAGAWARTALREAGPFGYARDEAEAAAGQAALALLATGRVEAGLELLRATGGSSTARYEAWAEVARLLTPDRPDSAAELLDALEEQAEDLAEDPGDGSAVAVQIWETVAAAAPGRVDRLHGRILDHARAVWDAAPTLENVSVLAGAACAVAQTRPQEATRLAALARRHVEAVLLTGAAPLSASDAFHREFGLRHTFARLGEALTDTGMPEEQVRHVLEPLLPDGPWDPTEPLDDADESEAERLADEALRQANLGNEAEAKSRLSEALALLPAAGPDTGRAPRWLPALAGALVRTDAAEDAEPLLDLWPDQAARARAYAAMAVAYADLGLADDARDRAHQAARAAALPAPDGAWAHAAQALACAGEAEAAEDLIRRHLPPTDRSKRAAWKTADRLARTAVAAGLAEHDPARSGRLILPLLKGLYAGRESPQGMSTLLARLAALLPAAACSGDGHPYEPLLHEVRQAGLAYADGNGPETWQPEPVLVHALLRIGEGEDPGPQLDWLTRDMAKRGPGHFPTAAFAVVQAACGDIEAAHRVAGRLTGPRARAAAFAAVAGHLARVPVRPLPAIDPAQPEDPFTRTIGHLALDATRHTPPDARAATTFLREVLNTAGWYQALPVLAHVEPEAVARVRDIVGAHAHAHAVRDSGNRVSVVSRIISP